MKISGNSIRPGNVIEHQGHLWVAVKISHTQPGKGGAYLQVELKDIQRGTKLNERFRSSETVERVHLDERQYQYLFNSGDSYTFMDTETYEQITLEKDFLGDSTDFLQPEMMVTVCLHDEKPITIRLPDTLVMTVMEADPVVKGQTASSSFKPAVLDNGHRVMVPPHIESGMKIIINTLDSTYVEKAKE